MSGHDDRNAGYWAHQIWHALTGMVNSAGNALGVNITHIAGEAIPSPDPIALPVSIDWFGQTTGDAFGRLKIAPPETVFTSKQLADTQPLAWNDVATSGAGTSSTYSANRASTTLGVSNLTAGTRVRQTYEWHNYQPGKAQEITMTGVFGNPTNGITRRWGQFNASNGLFFELNSAGVRACRRTNVTGTPADNYSDYLNMTLSNGVTISPANANVWFIAYQWLGAGTAFFGVSYGGRLHILATVENSNALTSVYMSTPNLPLRYEISNDGSGPAATIEHICTTVVSSGGRQATGIPLSVDRGATPLTTGNNASIYPLISIRKRTGYEGATILPINLTVMCTSAAVFRWALYLNPTFAGTELAYTTLANSAIEYNVVADANTTITGGTQFFSDYSQQSAVGEGVAVSDAPPGLRLGVSVAGVADILVLGVQRLTGTTETFYGSLNWREEF